MKMTHVTTSLRNRIHREGIYSTAEYWDSKAQGYSGNAVSMWPNNNLNVHYHRETMNVIDRYLPDVRGLRIMDLGCGTGRIARYLAQKGAHVVGIDFSSKSLELARRAGDMDTLEYRHQSMFDLEDRDAFDRIVSWGSVAVACKNAEQLRDVARRMRRALTRGGEILFVEPIHRGFLHRVLNMPVREFCRTMEEVGFRVEDVWHMHFWPMRLMLAFVPWPAVVTTPIYHAGQMFMQVTGHRILGDYKAIHLRT